MARLLAGEQLGTAFIAEGKVVSPLKRWIGFSANAKGMLILDDGACEAIIKKGRSLLPIGIRSVEGSFEKGDVVKLCDGNGEEVGRGLTNYDSSEIEKIQGLQTDGIEAALGCCPYSEVIHRDNMAITGQA